MLDAALAGVLVESVLGNGEVLPSTLKVEPLVLCPAGVLRRLFSIGPLRVGRGSRSQDVAEPAENFLGVFRKWPVKDEHQLDGLASVRLILM